MITTKELIDKAALLSVIIRHDYGGYRIVSQKGNYLFPADGIYPTVNRNDYFIWLLGYEKGIHENNELIAEIARLREAATKEQGTTPEKTQPLSYHFFDGYLQALREIRKYVLDK